jgi:hypothetical protein
MMGRSSSLVRVWGSAFALRALLISLTATLLTLSGGLAWALGKQRPTPARAKV